MDTYTILKDIVLPVVSIMATPIAFYLGFTKGTGKTMDVAFDKLEKRMKESPTAQRLLKLMNKSDELFGDDKAVEQITGFFREARALVTSPEAKNFFTNATQMMKEFSSEKQEEKVEIELPKRPN
jgi:hypothetical protein